MISEQQFKVFTRKFDTLLNKANKLRFLDADTLTLIEVLNSNIYSFAQSLELYELYGYPEDVIEIFEEGLSYLDLILTQERILNDTKMCSQELTYLGTSYSLN